MSFLIIVFVVLSLVGSVMWVMPTKRDRHLAHLRMQAKKLGFQVQLTKLVFPREKGEMEPREVSTVAYRLLRGKVSQDDHHNWQSWRVAKCEANASEGLIDGWAWALGERRLQSEKIKILNAILVRMPGDVIGVESTPVHLSVFWSELEESDMHEIQQLLEQLKANTL